MNIYIYGLGNSKNILVHGRMQHVLTLTVVFNHACMCSQCKTETMLTHSLNSTLFRSKTCVLKAHEHDSAHALSPPHMFINLLLFACRLKITSAQYYCKHAVCSLSPSACVLYRGAVLILSRSQPLAWLAKTTDDHASKMFGSSHDGSRVMTLFDAGTLASAAFLF